MAECVHGQRHKGPRTKLREGYIRCENCGKTFADQHYKVRHGTYRGYNKHNRTRKGSWPWPIPAGDPCGCQQARKERDAAHEKLPESKAGRKTRSAARWNTLRRLRAAFPAVYNQVYREELTRARSGAPQYGGRDYLSEVPLWDDLVARLVKEAMGSDEATLNEKVRARLATTREREVMRLVARLRVLLSAKGKS